jgi:hypothetical protein
VNRVSDTDLGHRVASFKLAAEDGLAVSLLTVARIGAEAQLEADRGAEHALRERAVLHASKLEGERDAALERATTAEADLAEVRRCYQAERERVENLSSAARQVADAMREYSFGTPVSDLPQVPHEAGRILSRPEIEAIGQAERACVQLRRALGGAEHTPAAAPAPWQPPPGCPLPAATVRAWADASAAPGLRAIAYLLGCRS